VPSGAPPQEFARRHAAPQLRRLLAGYHGYRLVTPVPATHRGLPSPYLTLIITLDDPLTIAAHPDPRQPPGRFDALVGGLHTTPALISLAGSPSGIQVALHPLGVRALLGVPAGELAGVDLHLADVVGPQAADLRERLVAAPGWSRRFDVLDDALGALLTRHGGGDRAATRPPEVARAWELLLTSGGRAAVGDVARDVGWSARRLQQVFRREVGLTPKQLARVTRFDRARRRLFAHADGARRPPSLARLAAEGGYRDQAHLAREFRDLAGCPPSTLLAEEFGFVQADAGPPDAA